ncbi:MAG: hypothetical protein HPY71_13780 [Firmicutes bacterium]|jgi:hypothetical protein|nr:hypothetical protein [Bacillota bacterium]
MSKEVMAFAVIIAALAAVIVLMGLGTIPVDVGVPILTAALGAAIGYLFPSPLNQ